MSLLVVRPGLQTTVQDLGRFGWQHIGIVPCGAMDEASLRLANVLVGNEPCEAALEITVRGPELLLERDTLIALCGAMMTARVAPPQGRAVPLPLNRPVLVAAGARLALGDVLHGARGYLAVAGGISVPLVLGSRATYVAGGFGGLIGRALRTDDRVPLAADADRLAHARFARAARAERDPGADTFMRSVSWMAPVDTLPEADPITVRCLEGRHGALFVDASRQAFVSEPYRLSADSNRMGYRLIGPKLERKKNVDVLSEPTCLGTVQVPADGVPIVLMADHQTTGGYAKIAEIAGVDIPRLAQLKPGESVRFQRVPLAEAMALRAAAKARRHAIEQSVRWKMREIGEVRR